MSLKVPAPVAKLLPYAKFIVTVAAIVAGVVVQVVAGPPAWALLIIAVAGALGVYTVPNAQIASIVDTIKSVLSSGEGVLTAAQAEDLVTARGKAVEAAGLASLAAQEVKEVAGEVKDQLPANQNADPALAPVPPPVPEDAPTSTPAVEATGPAVHLATTDPAEPGPDTSKTAVENEPEVPGPPTVVVEPEKPEDPEPPVTKVGV